MPADDTRQKPGTTITRHYPQVDERFAKQAVGRPQTQITHAGQIHPGPNRRSVDCGDHRNFAFIHGQRQLLDTPSVLILNLDDCAGEKPLAVAHLLDIPPGRERAARPGQNQYGHIRTAVAPAQGGNNVLYERGAGQRISHIIPFESQFSDPVFQAQPGIGQLRQPRHQASCCWGIAEFSAPWPNSRR